MANLLTVNWKLTSLDIKHITWWIKFARDGEYPWERNDRIDFDRNYVLLLDKKVVKEAAEAYLNRYGKGSSSTPTYTKLFG